jgi:hypothetical protein
MHEEFFGEDGVRDTAARVDWLAPIDAFTLQATVAAIGGSSLLGPEDHLHSSESTEQDESPEIGASGRVNLFVEQRLAFPLHLGTSVLPAKPPPPPGGSAPWVYPAGTLPGARGATRALVTAAEATIGRLDATVDTPAFDPNGWFAAGDLRWNKRWNAGAFGESTTARLASARAHRFGVFAGLALMEESTLFRIVLHQTDLHERDQDTGVLVQALFALGPHRPHRY